MHAWTDLTFVAGTWPPSTSSTGASHRILTAHGTVRGFMSAPHSFQQRVVRSAQSLTILVVRLEELTRWYLQFNRLSLEGVRTLRLCGLYSQDRTARGQDEGADEGERSVQATFRLGVLFARMVNTLETLCVDFDLTDFGLNHTFGEVFLHSFSNLRVLDVDNPYFYLRHSMALQCLGTLEHCQGPILPTGFRDLRTSWLTQAPRLRHLALEFDFEDSLTDALLELFRVLAAHCRELAALKLYIIGGVLRPEACRSIPTTLRKLVLALDSVGIQGFITEFVSGDARMAERATEFLQPFMPGLCELTVLKHLTIFDVERMAPKTDPFRPAWAPYDASESD